MIHCRLLIHFVYTSKRHLLQHSVQKPTVEGQQLMDVLAYHYGTIQDLARYSLLKEKIMS